MVYFYIIGCNKLPYKVHSRKLKNFLELDTALEEMNLAVKEMRFEHLYLIADFGICGKMYRCSLQHEPSMQEDSFFVIGEWHRGEDRNEFIRRDITQILMQEIALEYTNNLKAIKKLLELINMHKPCIFQLMMVVNDQNIKRIVYRSSDKSIKHCKGYYFIDD